MIHGLGAERTFVPMALWVDLCGGAIGQVETTQERGGPSPGRRSRIHNTLNEFLVFDLSLAIWSIRTNHLRGSSYGYPGVVVSAEAFLTSATEWRAPDWTGTPLG